MDCSGNFPGDYGIDCEVEIVDKDGSVIGARVLAQLKGTEVTDSSQKDIVQVKTSTVRYWVSLPVPVIIVRVSDDRAKVAWLDVRHHLQEIDKLEGIYITTRKTTSFNFANANELQATCGELRQIAIDHQNAVASMREEDERRLGADFMGYFILVKLFESDVDKWMQWLRNKGSGIDQIVHDYPFAVWLKSQLKEDPGPDQPDQAKMVTETVVGREKQPLRESHE